MEENGQPVVLARGNKGLETDTSNWGEQEKLVAAIAGVILLVLGLFCCAGVCLCVYYSAKKEDCDDAAARRRQHSLDDRATELSTLPIVITGVDSSEEPESLVMTTFPKAPSAPFAVEYATSSNTSVLVPVVGHPPPNYVDVMKT